jgi:uncharacterized protein (DUF302 family)
MSYFFAKTIPLPFDQALEHTVASLKTEGFGVLTEIDVQATLKKKLGADFRPYRILGACNPPFAHQALLAERHLGILLPCNVVVQQADGGTEVSAVNPMVAMQSVNNPALAEVAETVSAKLRRVIDSL